MNIELLRELAILFVIFTITMNIISIIKNLLDSRKYYHANEGIENINFPSTNSFTYEDLDISMQFRSKFRGSVRLSSSDIFTDEQIAEKRKKARIPLP